MLEIARPEIRSEVRAHPQRYNWGIVDVILAVILLPFAVWVWLIDRMVWAIAKLQRQ
jgi:cell division protein FtsB